MLQKALDGLTHAKNVQTLCPNGVPVRDIQIKHDQLYCKCEAVGRPVIFLLASPRVRSLCFEFLWEPLAGFSSYFRLDKAAMYHTVFKVELLILLAPNASPVVRKVRWSPDFQWTHESLSVRPLCCLTNFYTASENALKKRLSRLHLSFGQLDRMSVLEVALECWLECGPCHYDFHSKPCPNPLFNFSSSPSETICSSSAGKNFLDARFLAPLACGNHTLGDSVTC
jgi:hypothetical protein